MIENWNIFTHTVYLLLCFMEVIRINSRYYFNNLFFIRHFLHKLHFLHVEVTPIYRKSISLTFMKYV